MGYYYYYYYFYFCGVTAQIAYKAGTGKKKKDFYGKS